MYDNIIVIPYRNRKKHLDYFISNTVPLIQEHLPNSKVVVIEQDNDKLFNRGKILNCGFKEFFNKTKYFIPHDVDNNPTRDTIINHYYPNVDDTCVKGIFTSPCDSLGGIIKISCDNIFRCIT